MDVRPLHDDDRSWVDELVRERWGAPTVVAHGRVYRPAELAGFVAVEGGETLGLATYELDGDACEVVTIDALVEGRGVGSALLEAVAEAARAAGCHRVWLITTNDNLRALAFYQKRGFELAALHRGAVDAARRLKPEISRIGAGGIPLRDELELERLL